MQEFTKDQFEKDWQKPYEWDDNVIKWFNTRPKVILDLMLRFPPDCKVKATKPLMVPRLDEIGIVVSYFESGLISVIVPGGKIKSQCEPEWLELVECRPGMTIEDIKKRLK